MTTGYCLSQKLFTINFLQRKCVSCVPLTCQVLQLFFRDYVHEWYYTISTDEGFLYDLRQTLQRAFIAFANR